MNLPTRFIVDYNKIYLCYYDPTFNELLEIDPSDLYLKVKPFEKIIRRFYIVSDSINSSLITIVVNIDGPQKHAYSVKARLGKEYSDIQSFEYSGNMSTVNVSLTENNYENAIPVDILIESFNKTETCNLLDISVSLSRLGL